MPQEMAEHLRGLELRFPTILDREGTEQVRVWVGKDPLMQGEFVTLERVVLGRYLVSSMLLQIFGESWH